MMSTLHQFDSVLLTIKWRYSLHAPHKGVRTDAPALVLQAGIIRDVYPNLCHAWVLSRAGGGVLAVYPACHERIMLA